MNNTLFPCQFCNTIQGVTCTEESCSAAGPGKPFCGTECRICWLRLKRNRANRFTATQQLTPIPNRCANLGNFTNETVECKTCAGKVMLKLFECSVYGKCTLQKPINGIACCSGTIVNKLHISCPNFRPLEMSRNKKWSYGLTTVKQRRADLLPRTLASLKTAGFNNPLLFVDGDKDGLSWSKEFGLEVTCRSTNIRTHGNWILGIYELFIREPYADLYAMFQDDFVTYPNLRQYLESCKYPDKGYWNLYTFPANQELCPAGYQGWYLSNQRGRGAVALVFDRATVLALLSSDHMRERPLNADRGWKAVDGGIVTGLEKAGWKEYVHNPSLVQHTGDFSTMNNKPHKKAESFRGIEFDALQLVV